MRPEDSTNPYEAPQSPIQVPSRSSAERENRRPMSVRIGTALVGAVAVMRVWLYWGVVAKVGIGKVLEGGVFAAMFDVCVLPLTAVIVLLFPRHILSYALLVMLITYLTYSALTLLWVSAAVSGFQGPLVLDTFGRIVPVGLMVWLLFRIAFGQPSRRYFGFADKSQANLGLEPE